MFHHLFCFSTGAHGRSYQPERSLLCIWWFRMLCVVIVGKWWHVSIIFCCPFKGWVRIYFSGIFWGVKSSKGQIISPIMRTVHCLVMSQHCRTNQRAAFFIINGLFAITTLLCSGWLTTYSQLQHIFTRIEYFLELLFYLQLCQSMCIFLINWPHNVCHLLCVYLWLETRSAVCQSVVIFVYKMHVIWTCLIEWTIMFKITRKVLSLSDYEKSVKSYCPLTDTCGVGKTQI